MRTLRILNDALAPRYRAGELAAISPIEPAPDCDVSITMKDGRTAIMRLIGISVDAVQLCNVNTPNNAFAVRREHIERIERIAGRFVPEPGHEF